MVAATRHRPPAMPPPILDVLRAEAPAQGRLLELASGTGQHAAEFAAALPGIDWQPTDVNPANLPGIAAWRSHSAAPNLQPPVALDAAQRGWSAEWPNRDLILMVNLLHLISAPAAETVLVETAAALGLPRGKALIYGPFLRNGTATSDGDTAFHASLQAQDPAIGYKDLAWVTDVLQNNGLSLRITEMPANNLMLIATRS